MVETLKKLKKLKGHSLDEWRVRGAQVFAICAERGGWSSQVHLPTDAQLLKQLEAGALGNKEHSPKGLLEHFRTRTTPKFFASFQHRGNTVHELHRRFGPAVEDAVLERAGRIIEGRFDLLGLRDLRFGDPIDWHLEPVSGKKVPLQHWSRINYLDFSIAGDKKIIWELNRHQYFATLGQAYWYTRDERYAQTFVAHLNSWMDQNPPAMGINWASSLEVAFRAISWLWALHFFQYSPYLTPQVFSRALKFLYLHGRHLETYLSTYFSPNTHLTGEALGLYYLGTLLPEFRRAAQWRATGERILLNELARHVKADGVYFEQTSYYHRYTTDFYTHFYLLSQVNKQAIDPKVTEKLTALLDHMMYITRPDGTTPFLGDDDGGRLVVLDDRAPNDFRAALATGAVLFGRPDYKYVAGEVTEETLWLLGSEGLQRFDHLASQPPAQASVAFTEGGYFVMRDSWSHTANYLLIDCGPHGWYNCGHAHADALSIDLAAHGRTLLIDPGTYTYTGPAELRDGFRSSAAHNTLTIDNESSSVPSGPFTWRQVAQSSLRAWRSERRFDFFEGAHDGYQRLPNPALHVRSLLFLKQDYWVMRDRVVATGTHRCDLRFHFVPDADPLIEVEGEVAAVRERNLFAPGLNICTFGSNGLWHEDEGWVSHCYAELVAAPVNTYTQTAEGTQELISFLLPSHANTQPARARELSVTGGRGFEIHHNQNRDLLLIRNGSLLSLGEITSDFEWAWIRYEPGQQTFRELVLLGGRYFRFGTQEVIDAAEQVGYLCVRREAEGLVIETDTDGALTVKSPGLQRIMLNGEVFPLTGEAVFFKHGQLRVGLARPATPELRV